MKVRTGKEDCYQFEEVDGCRFAGILITGGHPNMRTAEVFLPETNRSCSLPPLTASRHRHTQSGLLACGGYERRAQSSCELLTRAGWRTEPYSLTAARCYHSSWDLNNGSVLLLGGYCSEGTSERVQAGSGTAPTFQLRDLVRFALSSKGLIDLLHPREACPIPEPNNQFLYLTGNWYDSSSSKVSKYGLGGFLEELPPLTKGRWDHACSGYYNEDNKFVLLVTGGFVKNTGGILST